MLTPPAGLTDHDLRRVIEDRWGVAVASIGYRAIGFGSHHWEAVDSRGARWFVTVDDLEAKRESRRDDENAAFDRLRAALETACDLRAAGCTFVVAPVASTSGLALERIDRRFALAMYPYVDGERYEWAEFLDPAHRLGVLDLCVALHAVVTAATPRARQDDFGVPYRDELESNLHRDAAGSDSGPYAARAARLIARDAARIVRLVARYDDLVEETRRSAAPMVLTHGEPHPGNTILTASGFVLIDWDTVLVAPPERDLWSLDPGDGSVIDAYNCATGTAPRQTALDLYRLRWDLAEVALYTSRFRAPHGDTADDEKSWLELEAIVGDLPADEPADDCG